ncbi:MAG TPA: hypothetical protein K8V84_13285 [Nocardiopsis listeri]|uniref:hypothetical protein n=1 Tax=Nocardiopsis listeri TaxID=53440 RepID=UPI001D9FDFCA|nr:hypothetical protein [Nocardiopsis listeri]HJE59460.1 hypothetical protein [Nocardiopsis listeri]
MHTSELMRTGEFVFSRGEDPVGFHDLLPGFTAQDRLGVVALEPGDSLRAAPLLLASVGAFYEELRATETDFYLYPDFFVFHVGGPKGRHSPLDVWPQSKEVIVPPDPQALLCAINDRGITRLILPNGPGAGGVVMLHAVQIAARRLRTILTTAADTAGHRWSVRPSEAAVPLISRCARVSADLLGEGSTDRWRATSSAAQGYTELSFDEALSALCAAGATTEPLGFSAEYRTRAGLTEGILARDRYTVGAPGVSGPPS